MTWKPLLPYGIIGALVIALVFSCGDESPEPSLSEKTQAEVVRLRAENAAYKKDQDSLRFQARASSDAARLRAEEAAQERARANRNAKDAERARVAVITAGTLRDSFDFMQVAYEERSREAEALRVESAKKDSVLVLERRAAELNGNRADRAEARVEALEALNQRILDDVAKAERGCQILGIVRCPTRKEAFVVGAVLGAGGALVAAVATR